MSIVNTHYGYCGNRAPALAGSWLFNETLTAFPTGLVENVNFTATGGGATLACIGVHLFLNNLSYKLNEGGSLRVYDFAKNKWNSDYKTVTFTESATVSEEFMNWLTANATKQS